MEKTINEEYEKFETILRGIDKQRVTLILTDIIANLTKNNEGKKDYTDFDELVKDIKALLDSFKGEIPPIDLGYSIKQTLDNMDRMKSECQYSMRTLSWIKNDLLNKEEKENA